MMLGSEHALESHFDNSQIIYKLGALEAQVKSLGENINSVFTRLEEKIDDASKYQNQELQNLKSKVADNEIRLNTIDDWRKNLVSKLTVLFGLISVMWLIFGTVIDAKIASMFS